MTIVIHIERKRFISLYTKFTVDFSATLNLIIRFYNFISIDTILSSGTISFPIKSHSILSFASLSNSLV